ncbi:MAG: hypothetical protein J6S62_05685 [Bacteroidales bacterium]|nr:hypothetical protein [Bacteroidales bacterium]
MKKTLILLLSALVALGTVSCGDAIEIPDVPTPEKPDEPSTPDGISGDVVFTATVESLQDGTQPGWEKGAKILLSDGSSTQTLTNSAEAGVTAKFPAKVAAGAKGFVAVAPASSGASISGTTVSVDLPATREIGADMPNLLVAKASGTQLYFKTLLAQLSFTVSIDGATKVVLKTAGGEKIGGKLEVDYSGEQPVITAQSDEITVTGSFENGKTYTVPVVPGQISGYSVVVYAGDQEKAHITGEGATLVPGLPAELPAFTADIPTYQIAKVQIWGGTGPEYNCSKVYNLFNKAGCFNDEDGRGILALQDNYFLLKEDGTYVNYAGEDGRNWWFVYSGSQNPENGKDVDLRSMFELLPLGEATYTIDGANISFTHPDGKVTTATFMEPGTYPMPGTVPEISVTLEKQTLMFQIKGGKDNWNFPWQDYGVIACRPRALFVEIEKMPDGFVVPEASRTFDTEFEYIPPVEPDDLFNWDEFAAHWNVLGGNSAPFGIWVLGGSGDDPAFVSPIDKSWDWDDSIWKESDNGLVVKVSSKTDTEIKGTTNWWSGDDGGFWNYTWKSTGEDLSKFYDKIPKGEKEFTLDLTTLTMTLANGEKAKFLTPGTHEFVYGKTIEVREGCFGLAFHNMDPIDATSSRWTDVDRFVYAPLEYVILFEK